MGTVNSCVWRAPCGDTTGVAVERAINSKVIVELVNWRIPAETEKETVNINASITTAIECVNVTLDTSYQLTRGTVRKLMNA